MKKFFLWLLAIVLVGCAMQGTLTHPAQQPNRVALVENLKSVTVALTKTDHDGDHSPYCTGVWISNDKILTANHCVEMYGRALAGTIFELETDEFDSVGVELQYVVKNDVNLSTPNNFPLSVRKGTVIAVSHVQDLALILAKDTPRDHLIANVKGIDSVPDGTRVHIVGHTIGLWWSYCEGTVSTSWGNIKGPDQIATHAMQISSATWRGNSGGGAFDDDGNLVGIASWVAPQGPNISFFIHHDELIKFLKKHLVKLYTTTVCLVFLRSLLEQPQRLFLQPATNILSLSLDLTT